MRPKRLGIIARPDTERQLGHFLGVDAPADLEQHDPREAVPAHSLDRELTELRPADGDPAVDRLAAVVVALGRTEDDGRLSGRTVREDVRPEERDLRRPVLARDNRNRIAGETVAKDDASRRPKPRI